WVRRLLEAVPLRGGVWFEPSAGDGAIIKVVQSIRQDISWVACDIRRRCREPLVKLIGASRVEIADFLKVEPRPVDVICTNPPFSLAEEFYHHALKFARWVVFLLRLEFLGPVRRDWVCRARMPCTHEQ